MKLLTALMLVLVFCSEADAGCRRRGGCRPSSSCGAAAPCQPVAAAVNATANVLTAPVRVLGGCAGGSCPR